VIADCETCRTTHPEPLQQDKAGCCERYLNNNLRLHEFAHSISLPVFENALMPDAGVGLAAVNMGLVMESLAALATTSLKSRSSICCEARVWPR
jgi:hypothetical protein